MLQTRVADLVVKGKRMCTLRVAYQYLVKNSSAHSVKRCRKSVEKEDETGGDSRFVYAFLPLLSLILVRRCQPDSRDLGPCG